MKKLRRKLIAEGQRLSALFDAGQLTHEEWARSLESFNEKIEQLPEELRGSISTELFQHIEPDH